MYLIFQPLNKLIKHQLIIKCTCCILASVISNHNKNIKTQMSTHIPKFLTQHFSNKQKLAQSPTFHNNLITLKEIQSNKSSMHDKYAHNAQSSNYNYESNNTYKLTSQRSKQYLQKRNLYLSKDISLDFQKILKQKDQHQLQTRMKSLQDGIDPETDINNEQATYMPQYKKTAQNTHKKQKRQNSQSLQKKNKQNISKFKPIYYSYKTKKQPRSSQGFHHMKDQLKETKDQDFTEELAEESTLKVEKKIQKKNSDDQNNQRRKTDILMTYSSPCDTRRPKTIRNYNKRTNRMDQFFILKELGKGNFGSVLLVIQAQTGSIYAMKIISKSYVKTQQHMEKTIFREIKIQLFLKNCYVIKLYHVFSDADNIYLLMEALGGNLYEKMLKKKNLSQQKTAVKLYQLIQAVDYLHQQRIIHRDIKLENILQFQGTVKLGDFGCSIHTRDLRKTKIGSLAYHSPQQLGQKFYDQKVDIWSLGIVTYQLLFGSTPFDRQIYQIIQYGNKRQLADLKFPKCQKVSEQAKDFILNLLKKNPFQRMSLQQALQHPFIKNNVRPTWQQS